MSSYKLLKPSPFAETGEKALEAHPSQAVVATTPHLAYVAMYRSTRRGLVKRVLNLLHNLRCSFPENLPFELGFLLGGSSSEVVVFSSSISIYFRLFRGLAREYVHLPLLLLQEPFL